MSALPFAVRPLRGGFACSLCERKVSSNQAYRKHIGRCHAYQQTSRKRLRRSGEDHESGHAGSPCDRDGGGSGYGENAGAVINDRDTAACKDGERSRDSDDCIDDGSPSSFNGEVRGDMWGGGGSESHYGACDGLRLNLGYSRDEDGSTCNYGYTNLFCDGGDDMIGDSTGTGGD